MPGPDVAAVNPGAEAADGPRGRLLRLERLVARDGETVSVLARELLDVVSVQTAWLAAEGPGFSGVFLAGVNGRAKE